MVHSTVGTPFYMSPECIQGTYYDWKSDIWSLGCLLYELATLRSPFFTEGLNYYTLGKKINKRAFEPISDSYSLQVTINSHAVNSLTCPAHQQFRASAQNLLLRPAAPCSRRVPRARHAPLPIASSSRSCEVWSTT